jgi:protein-disulfide isomerase
VRAPLRAAAALLAAALGACGGEGAGGPVAPGPLRIAVGDAPQRGPSDAWVTVVEFSDFQCPFCGAAAPVVADLLAERPDDVRLLYRHLPLSQHPRAVPAAVAAECARVQGPAPDGFFWALHDRMFANQDALLDLHLAAYAGQIAGLDAEAWSACLATAPPLDRVSADRALAVALGIPGTPSFVVNGTLVPGVGGLRAAVDAAQAAAVASGIPRAEYYDRAVLGLGSP